MKLKKRSGRLIALLLCLVMLVTLSAPAMAVEADGNLTPEEIAAHNAEVMEKRWLNYRNDCFSWQVWRYSREDSYLKSHGVDLDSIGGGSYQFLYSVSQQAIDYEEDISDLEKVQRIARFVADRVAYNGSNVPNGPVQTLLKGRGVCENYAQVVEALVQMQDIPCVCVEGYKATYPGYVNPLDAHTWNAAYVDGEWIYIDATWMSTWNGNPGFADWGGVSNEDFAWNGMVGHWASEIRGRYTKDDAGWFNTQDPTSGVIMASGESTTFWWESPAPSKWAQAEIWDSMTKGLVPGALEAQYQKNITRQQFCRAAMYAWNALRPDAQPTETITFNDTTDKWVLQAASYGFVNGNGRGGFWPDISISRQEAATILMRVAEGLGMSGGGSGSSYQFSDSAQIDSWARDAVDFAADSGLMKGSNGKFMPKSSITIEEALLIFYRLYERNV